MTSWGGWPWKYERHRKYGLPYVILDGPEACLQKVTTMTSHFRNSKNLEISVSKIKWEGLV